ncbi:MAG: D-alanyl-D-alanine carboxypeptidase family protein [Dialister sp.]|nr:D-alanyl-D-alanine carboxypeptidase family protein [Dialister sp.]
MARRKQSKRRIGCIRLGIIMVMMLFVLSAVVFGLLVLLTPEPPAPPVPLPAPATEAKAAALYDANRGELLAEKNGVLRIYPASTTKVLTCIIALEEGQDKLNDPAVISDRAIRQDGTNIGLRRDMPISLRELLYGMMLVSGNDSAVAVAETTGGSYDRFVAMMNEKAVAIGAIHSHFANPNGLTDPDHYTSAEDMVKISAYAMKNPEFRDIVKRVTYPMTYMNGIYRDVENRNEFLSSGYPGANGVKTGMTEAAGECLVASAEQDGELLIVSLYDDEKRFEEVKVWLDFGFEMIRRRKAYEEALRREPPVYKFINQLMGKEPHE